MSKQTETPAPVETVLETPKKKFNFDKKKIATIAAVATTVVAAAAAAVYVKSKDDSDPEALGTALAEALDNVA